MADVVEIETIDGVAQGSNDPVEKKPFVAPKISVPVDVLEATTYFQAVESGATN